MLGLLQSRNLSTAGVQIRQALHFDSPGVANGIDLNIDLPETVPATTVDRQCGSSQQALHFAAQGVLAGAYDIVIAAGVEVMTRTPMGASVVNGELQLAGVTSTTYSQDCLIGGDHVNLRFYKPWIEGNTI